MLASVGTACSLPSHGISAEESKSHLLESYPSANYTPNAPIYGLLRSSAPNRPIANHGGEHGVDPKVD